MMKKLLLAIMAIFMLAISIAGCGTSPKEEAEAFNEKYYTQAYYNGLRSEMNNALQQSITKYGNSLNANAHIGEFIQYNEKFSELISTINNVKIENKEVEPLKTLLIKHIDNNKIMFDAAVQGDFAKSKAVYNDCFKSKFDYLNEFCKVVYLPRTAGISSTMLREESQPDVKVGIIGCGRVAQRFPSEASVVSGVQVCAAYDIDKNAVLSIAGDGESICGYTDLDFFFDAVDAVYIATPHLKHGEYIRKALKLKKHVLCETPMVLDGKEAKELYECAEQQGCILMEGNKTAHCPAFNHLIVMIKSGVIGNVVDIEASLSKLWDDDMSLREFDSKQAGGSLYELGSYPLLPIIKLLGIQYRNLNFYSRIKNGVDMYTRGVMRYDNAVCSFKVGLGVKTEGNLVVSGTKGYVYVPAPWWKTDYFELRYENQNENKKFFYKWDGYGLRYEIQEFISCIINHRFSSARLRRRESICMAEIMQQFAERKNFYKI